jgi:Pro-kumamolisin, activation domain/Repeat of unknown function (DUF346)
MASAPTGYRRMEKSERRVAPGSRLIGLADPKEALSVTVRVRRRPDAPPLPDPASLGAAPAGKKKYLSREEFAARYGAAQADLDLVAKFAQNNGLTVVESSVARRSVVISGTVAQMNLAFAVKLGHYESPAEKYRGREGFVHLPDEMAEIVEGVFGLDNRRMARPLLGQSSPSAAGAPLGGVITPVTPPQVAKMYNFPTAAKAVGQTIGLLEFGGGFAIADMEKYFTGSTSPIGPGFTTPTVVAVLVDGATNSPDSGNDSAEVALDIEVAGSVAQGAKIAVYFAPWTEQGWVDAVTTAVHDATNHPSVLSISWGWPEFQEILGLLWSAAAIEAVSATFQEAAVLGVTVFAASGDAGSGCGIGDGKAHVLYPASDPGLTACGGTTIEDISGSAFTEVTWNDNGITGGGISDQFAQPSWQSAANIPNSINPPGNHRGRGVPDVSGYANGYVIIFAGANQGSWWGTSEVAPLYAGLVALLNASLEEPVGYLNPQIYPLSGPSLFRDIADGGSNATGGAPGYKAGPGWDACTGLGVVNGGSLMNALRANAPVNRSVVSWSANRLDIFGLGTDHAMYHKAWNGSAWLPSSTGWEGLGGLFSYSYESPPAVAAWAANRLDVFDLGTDNQMYHKYWDGSKWGPSPTGWEALGGVFTSPPSAVAWGANRLDIFGLGTDRQMYHKYWNGSQWGPSPTGWEALGGVFTSPPSAVAWGANRLDIFGLGTDRQMYHKYWNGSQWGPSATGWEALGGVFSSPPAAVSWAPNRLDIFGLGTDFQMYHKYWDGSKWGPSATGWEALGGVFSSPPSAVAWSANRLDIFGLGTDRQMYHKYWDGSKWGPSATGWEALGGVFASPPAAVAWTKNRLDIFGLGTDRQMYHKYWDGNKWGPSATGWEGLGGVFTEP